VRRSPTPIRKHTLNLYKGDYEILQAAFPQKGAAAVIRAVIRNFIRQHQLDMRSRNDRQPQSPPDSF
jgi:hypothetical protein